MTSASIEPVAQLAWHYKNPMAQALERHNSGVPVVGVTSNTVPWELLSAAGLFPVVLRPPVTATPFADEFMEENVFHPRIRNIFEQAVSGKLQFLEAIIIPRTSEQEYKLFLYLREVARTRADVRLPPVYLYDLLHYRSAGSHAYGLQRTHALKQQIEKIAGRPIAPDELSRAIRESNAARAVVRSLLRLREGTPRLSGSDALTLVGAFWFMDRAEYAKIAQEAAVALERRPPLRGARLIVKGLPLDHNGLHRILESHGAVVVAEDDWWGTRSAGDDIPDLQDGITAVFEKYYFDSPSARVFPPAVADEWFETAARNGTDGVVFYLPEDDYVAGWDYPRQKLFLDKLGIPNILVRSDAVQLDPKESERIEHWVHGITVKR
jgi:benzoyl-CoA reductase/2-hydroxyglutaryl-CoA dehydratase subunit BcrC/BadD/HgdB